MVKIIKTLGKIYLAIIALHTIAAKPAVEVEKEETAKTETAKTEIENTSTVTDTSPIKPLSERTRCKEMTKSCEDGFSCIRFNSDKENEFTCIQNEFAFCEDPSECISRLGENYKFCYVPPWSRNASAKKQCFTEQASGSPCLTDAHCVNTLQCIDNICISPRNSFLREGTEDENKGDGTILGINKWIFIIAVSFPFAVLFLCMWCWLIGRSSSKTIENRKKEKYEKELKEYSLSQNKKDGPLYVNPQKQLEEEVGIRTFKSLFRRKKAEEANTTTATTTTTNDKKTNDKQESDISNTKVGGKAPINTNTTSDTQQKMKKNLSSTNSEDKDKNSNSGDSRTSKKSTDATKTTAKTAAKPKITTKNANKNTTRNAVKSPSTSSATSPAMSSPSGKPRANKKKAAGAKKAKKASSNDTNTNSTSSKQSSQRGLVSNAANLSSALSGQSASYFNGASPIDTQSALYYQQMYGNPAAAAAAQNQYYASYLQNPYYAAAAAQNAAYYGQDPNLMYGAYPNTTNYQ